MKDVFKKDSLQVRYNEKSLLLDNYIKENEKTNLLINSKIEEIERLNEQINKKNEELIKSSKRQNNRLFYGVTGVCLGIVIGVLID